MIPRDYDPRWPSEGYRERSLIATACLVGAVILVALAAVLT